VAKGRRRKIREWARIAMQKVIVSSADQRDFRTIRRGIAVAI
jgi:hypothetical protein